MCKIFVALNFRCIAHQQNFFNDHCVKNGDVRMSCYYAMATDVPTKHSSGLYLLYGPRFFPSASARSVSIRAPPDSLRQYLAKESDRDLLGSGSPSAGLKNHRRTVSAAQVSSVLVYTVYMRLTVKMICCC